MKNDPTTRIHNTLTPLARIRWTGKHLLLPLILLGLSAAVFAQPTTPATNIIVTPVTTSATSLIFDWTNGDGASRIVVIGDATGTYTPTNGAPSPTANLSFTGGSNIGATGNVRCVFNGSGGSPITVTGLSANTKYYIQVFEYNGAAATPTYIFSPGTKNPTFFQNISTVGANTYNVTTGIHAVNVEAWGAGGGGGGPDSNNSENRAGGGGAGGAYQSGTNIAVSTNVTVTIGAGGAGGSSGNSPANGGDGGNTTFGALLTANGGGGGKLANSSDRTGNGGTAPTGTKNGGAGGEAPPTGTTTDATGSGGGGSGASRTTNGNAAVQDAPGAAVGGGGSGAGAAGVTGVASGTASQGVDATELGGGGSGGWDNLANGNTTVAKGGSGFRGQAIVNWTQPTPAISVYGGTPTNGKPVFRVIFSTPITLASFTAGDVAITGTAMGTLVPTIAEIAPNNGTTFTITVSGMTASGTVIANIAATKVTDLSGNDNLVSNPNTTINYVHDVTGATPTISVQGPNPTNAGPIFKVIFNEAINVATFVGSTVSLSGTAGATTATIAEIAPNDGTTFTITASGMTGVGTVIANIAAGAGILDLAATPNNNLVSNAGTTINYDNQPPIISATSPGNNAFVKIADVSYTLSKNVASASVTYTHTGGTADSNHTLTLSGGQLTSGAHTISTGLPTLVSGAIYTLTFAATDAATNTATPVNATNVTYDTSPPTISAHSITNITQTTFDYNITSSEVGTAYYEVTTSATPPTPAEIKTGTGPGHIASGNFVIPVAGANTVKNITPLLGGTQYYVYAVTEDQATNQSASVVSDNATTLCVPPSTQASIAATPFTAISTTGLTYNWVRGDGTGGVIVVARQGSAVSFTPTSGTTYAGQINSVFTSATDQGSGNRIVYRGPATSVAITGLTANTTYHFAVFEYNTAGDCYMTTTPLIQNQATSAPLAETTLNTGSGTASISSLVTTVGAEVAVFTFQATDAGADGVNTLISNMVIKPGTGNAFGTLTQLIAGADLFDDLGNSKAAVVAGGTITISAIPNGAGALGEVVNGSTKIYTLKVYLNNPLNAAIRATADGQTLVLSLVNTDVTAGATGSGIAASTVNSGSGNGVIDVIATELRFIQNTSNVLNGNAMSPAVTIEATDSHGARDKGFVSTVGVTSTGTLSVSPTNATFVLGVGTYNNIIHTVNATARQLTTNSGLNNPTSNTFDITSSANSNITVNGGFSYPQNIPYDIYQENFDIQNTGTSIVVGKFDINDSDPDGAPTVLTSLSLDLGTNFNFIRRIALYDATGTVEFTGSETAVSSQIVNLSGFTITAADNASTPFTVRVSFKNLVTDNQQFSIKINNTGTLANASSTFTVPNAGGATTSTGSDNNRIEVTVTRPLFVQQASNTIVNVAMSPAPTVEAVDVFANRDLDCNLEVDMYSYGVLAVNPNVGFFVNGFATFPNVIHSVPGTGIMIEAYIPTLFTWIDSNPVTIFAKSADIVSNALFITPTNIPYDQFQEASNIQNSGTSIVVGKFDVRDGGGAIIDADGAPTILNNLSLDLGSNFNFIRRIALYDATGTVELAEQAVGSQIVNFSGFTVTAPDNSTASFTVRVSFTTSVVDGQYFVFSVNAADVQAGTSSGFAAANAGGASTPTLFNRNKIQVTATQLRFIQQPTNTFLRVNMAPVVTIEAVDALLLRDLDFASSVPVLSTGTLLSSPQNATFSAGLGTYSTVNHSQTGTGLQLSTNYGLLADATSVTFNITASNASDIIEDPTFVYPTNIAYNNFQEGTDISNLATSIIAAGFVIRDGGGAADPDGAPTTVSSFSIDLGSNWTLLRRIAVYDTFGGELSTSDKPVTSQIMNFSGFPPFSIPDGSSLQIRLRVSFKSSVTDNLQFSFKFIAANTSPLTSSAFALLDAGGATSSVAGNDNRIEVTATRLSFTTAFTSPLLANTDISLQQVFVPVLKALDVLNNLDLDYAASVSLSNVGSLPMTPSSTLTADNAAPNAGVYTFPSNFRFGTTGDGTLTATSGVLTQAVSIPITVQAGTATKIAAGAPAPATISSLSTNPGPAVTVFNFDVIDDKTPVSGNNDDGLPTLITQLFITANPTSNSIGNNWSNAIADATLFDGNGNSIGQTSIGSNFIFFNGIPTTVGALGYVPDNGTQHYTLKIHLRNPMLGSLPATVDGLQFQFEVQQVNISTAANSSFIIGGENASSGNADVVDVQATKLSFNAGLPASASLNSNYTGYPIPNDQVKIEAVDINGNRDLNYTQLVRAFTNQTNQSMINQPVVNSTPFTAGLLTMNSNFQFTSGGNGVHVDLSMTAGPASATLCGTGGNICGTSTSIQIQVSAESSLIKDPTYSFLPTLDYASFQEAAPISSSSVEVARYILLDGGRTSAPFGSNFVTINDTDAKQNGDVDGATTNLTSLTLRVSNPASIRSIALFSGGSKLQELPGTTLMPTFDFVFNAINLVAPDDGSAPLSVRVSFKSTAPEIVDQNPLDITVVAASTTGGSDFTNYPTLIGGVDPSFYPSYVAASPAGFNRIDVIAKKLDFSGQAAPPAYFGLETISSGAGVVSATDQNGLLDTDINGVASVTGAAASVTGTYAFTAGVLDLNGQLKYSNTGDGQLTVTTFNPVLGSTISSSTGGTPSSAVNPLSQPIEVIHVTTQLNLTAPSPGSPLLANSKNQVIFGFQFSSQRSISNHPKINSFRISFNHAIAGVFSAFTVLEATNGSYATAVDVTTVGGATVNASGNDIVVNLGTPRDLMVNPNLSYFLKVDVNVNVNGNTPTMTPSIIDLGGTDPTAINIQADVGTQRSTLTGSTYSFASIAPPTLVSSYPAAGQTNVDITQPSIELTFNVPVYSLDRVVKLWDNTGGATPVLVETLTALDGDYTIPSDDAQPIHFKISPGKLVSNHDYFVTVDKGVFDGISGGTGIMDVNLNLFGGISYPGTVYFRTSDDVAPKMLGLLTTPSAPLDPFIPNPAQGSQNVNSATINAIFDKQGTAFYLVLPTIGAPTPTKDDVFNPTAYAIANPGKVQASGSFPITSTNTVTSFGIMTPSSGTFAPGDHNVWVVAQAYKEKKSVAASPGITTVPIPVTGVYGGSGSNFVVNGTGPTLQFNSAAAASPSNGVSINTLSGGLTICSNSYQILNKPIVITEGTLTTFSNAPTGGTQSLSLVLPAGFQFDITPTSGGVPKYGTLTLRGADFVGASSISFLSNSVLKITFQNATNNSAGDQIIISNLRILATGSQAGSIFRLGGNAIPSIGDGAPIGNISAAEAAPINFNNTYSSTLPSPSILPSKTPETAIPDNVANSNVVLTPYISNSYDFGPSTFSGQGINGGNILNVKGVTNDEPFNITITHTDNNGCVSQNAVQYLVYDHNKAVNITDNTLPIGNPDQGPYCSKNPNFQIDQQNAFVAATGTIRNVKYNNLPGYYLENLKARIPANAPSTAIINPTNFGGAWVNIIEKKLINDSVVSPPINSITYMSYAFDDKTIVNANAISLGAIPYLYDLFAKKTDANGFYPQQTYYTGGSLGKVELTGTFRNSSNTTVSIKRRQIIEFFLPAIPAVEVVTPYSYLADGLNAADGPINTDPLNGRGTDTDYNGRPGNLGTPVFCEASGDIAINGWPKPTNSADVAYFKIYNTVGGAEIIPNPSTKDFVDNGNGTAKLNPLLLNNAYNDIKIVYTYQQTGSPCPSTAYQYIRIAANPVAVYTQKSAPSQFVVPTATINPQGNHCEKQPVLFDGSGSNVAGPLAVIKTYDWDFTDATNSTSANPNRLIGPTASSPVPSNGGTYAKPTHSFNQSAQYSPLLTVTSNLKCVSLGVTHLVDVGAIPQVSFGFLGVSNADHIQFNNTSSIPSAVALGDGLSRLDWRFGDGAKSNAQSNVTHQYVNPGVYDGSGTTKPASLRVVSIVGCTDSIAKSIVILKSDQATQTAAYRENFESPVLPNGRGGSGQWQVFNTGSVSTGGIHSGPNSWSYNNTTGASLIVPTPGVTGASFWKSNDPATGQYLPNEHSALYSPSFDITDLKRPMVSFDSYVQMRSGDGVVLQYSFDNKNVADPTKQWIALGIIGEGVDWFTDQGISASPGEQTANLGWGDHNRVEWIQPKHTLDEVYAAAGATPVDHVVFRFALASAGNQPGFEGFGLDNFRVGERTRTILLENFTNASNTNSAELVQANAMSGFQSSPSAIGTEVVKLNYHVSFPNRDPLNEDNPADPSSRALFYNIQSTPVARMDGSDGPHAATIPNEPFDIWKKLQYDTRTLNLAQANIIIRPDPAVGSQPTDINKNGKLRFFVDIQPTIDLDASTILQIAIVEEKIPLASLPSAKQSLVKSGETQFEWVVKKMLPSASGTKTSTHPNATPGTGVLVAPPPGSLIPITYTFGPFEWVPDVAKMYAPTASDLAITVFLQNEATRVVYQAELVKDLDDPATNVITGLEPVYAEDVKIFPVPANKEMHIEMPGVLAEAAPIQLIDATGRTAIDSQISAGQSKKTLNVGELAPGVYILQINVGNGNFTRKKVMVVHEGN